MIGKYCEKSLIGPHLKSVFFIIVMDDCWYFLSFVFVFVFLLTTDGGNEGEVITRSPLGAGPGLPRALSRIQKIPHLRIHQLASNSKKEPT